MLKDQDEALKIIQEYTSKNVGIGNHSLYLRTPLNYIKYYDPNRAYPINGIFKITKKDLGDRVGYEYDSRYGSEYVKFVSQTDNVSGADIQNRELFRTYQMNNEISYWLVDERCLKGNVRRSILNDELYEATIDIPKADKDPSLTTDGKWIKIEPQIV